MSGKKCFLFLFSILLLISCTKKTTPEGPENPERNLVIFYTNDEHGWMDSTSYSGGAAGMVGLWKEKEGYRPDGPYVVLSGGDMWTGPAISTWFKGESMVEVMNAMHYRAAAIGNHEFDFNVEGLRDRLAQATFPFLSANIREKVSGNVPDFATPYIIHEVNGIKLGLIGLTTRTTPFSAFPAYVADYDFIDYGTALNEYVPQLKAERADIIMLIGYICFSEMEALLPIAKDLGISIMGGGHCHEAHSAKIENIALLESGSHLENYAKVDLFFDISEKKMLDMIPSWVSNTGGTPDPEIQAIVTKWDNKMDESLSNVIGFASADIGQRSIAIRNMVTDSWLVSIPSADVSLSNSGGIRQAILAGDINLEVIVGVLPFNNEIVEMKLTGRELIDNIHGEIIIGGITTIGGYYLSDGTQIHMDSTYDVLTTDYLYSRTDFNFQIDDPEPYNTSINYRQPTIDWIESLQTSDTDPLNNHLDGVARQ